MKKLVIRIRYGRENESAETYRDFIDYNDAVAFRDNWTACAGNWASAPEYAIVTID